MQIKTSFLHGRSYPAKISLFTTLLALIVVVLGAYTRLTDAGLGCPDWPLCYGQWVPKETSAIHTGINLNKAWTEMLHRYLAATLGFMVVVLNGIVLSGKPVFKTTRRLALTLLALVIFQGLLGKWTVTLKLLPVVVMSHLLGGLTTLSLLWWLTLTLQLNEKPYFAIEKIPLLKFWGGMSLLILMVQLFLGGWTSANYAALVCLDFPACHAHQSYTFEFLSAFNFFKAGVSGIIGDFLSNDARITIHMLHRFNAIFTVLAIVRFGWLTFSSTSYPSIRSLSVILIGALLLQVLLGITNVIALLPLSIALAHNAVAALLLLILVTFNYYFYLPYQGMITKKGYVKSYAA